MKRQSGLEKAIASIDSQIQVLELAKRHLIEQQKSAASKPGRKRQAEPLLKEASRPA